MSNVIAAANSGNTYSISAQETEALTAALWGGISEAAQLGAINGAGAIGEAGLDAAAFSFGGMSNAASQAASSYTYDLVGGINNTSRTQLQNAISAWLEQSPREIDDLTESVAAIFGEARAENIAVTEVTRAISTGQEMAWREINRQYGEDIIVGRQWLTANDDRVCAICAPLGGLIFNEEGPVPTNREAQMTGAITAALGAPFIHPGGGGNAGKYAGQEFPQQPAHPRCRCDQRAVYAEWVNV